MERQCARPRERRAAGREKLYSVTEAGLTHLEGQPASVDALLEQLAYSGRRVDEVRRAMGSGDAPNDAADFDSPQAFGGRGRQAVSERDAAGGASPTMRRIRTPRAAPP